MPLPLLFIAVAAATGALGVGKSVKAAVDTHDANETNKKANDIINDAKNALNQARKRCGSDLELLGKTKIKILDSSINEFVRSFSKLKNVNLQQSSGLNEIRYLCIDSAEFIELAELGNFASSIASGIAGGALGGAITAFGAYSAASTFAAASTGTTIASLSGVAASNATLAFFGGGSLAAGGLGVAGGTMVLGGLMAGPALAIMGVVIGAKANSAKNEAYSNLAKALQTSKELEVASDLCYAISEKCNLFINLLKKLDKYFKPIINKMEEAIAKQGTDFRNFTQEQKQTIASAASLAKAIKMVLDTPILDKNGKITSESNNILNNIKPYELTKDIQPIKLSKRKFLDSRGKEIELDEIIKRCQFDVLKKRNLYDYKEKYAKIRWDTLISYVNSSYGMNCTLEEYKSHISVFGESNRIWISELTYALGSFILTYQISLIVESCLLQQTSFLQEEDIDWDKLISKISNIYGVSMIKWQLFHPGRNKAEDILGRIYEKIRVSRDNYHRCYYIASEFKKLMLKEP